jgi:hypothetical protein
VLFALLLAQTSTPPAVNPEPVLRRMAQSSAWSVPWSVGSLLLVLIACWLGWAALAALVQRDRRSWARGVFDIRGNLEQFSDGLRILGQNKRPLWLLLVAAVLSWTGWGLRLYDESSGLTELQSALQVQDDAVNTFAMAHALTAAAAPLGRLISLADLLPVLAGAGFVLLVRAIALSDDLRRETRVWEASTLKQTLVAVWMCLLLTGIYRLVTFVWGPGNVALVGCLFIDSFLLPLAILAADGLMLSWVATEYGRAVRGHFEWRSTDTAACARGIRSGICFCLLINPGRYLLVGLLLWRYQLGNVAQFARWFGSHIEWLLGVSLVLQLVGLVWVVGPAVMAVRRTGLLRGMAGCFRLYERAGGQVVGLAGVAATLIVLCTLPVYWAFGNMQPERWSLLGMSSYAYYATLLVNLCFLAALTRVAERALGIEDPQRPAAMLLEPAAKPARVVREAELAASGFALQPPRGWRFVPAENGTVLQGPHGLQAMLHFVAAESVGAAPLPAALRRLEEEKLQRMDQMRTGPIYRPVSAPRVGTRGDSSREYRFECEGVAGQQRLAMGTLVGQSGVLHYACSGSAHFGEGWQAFWSVFDAVRLTNPEAPSLAIRAYDHDAASAGQG